VLVKVSPGQLASLQSRCGELVEELSLRAELSLVADESIAPGGVKVVHRNGEIDATIDGQLAALAEALLSRDEPLLRAMEGTYQAVDAFEPARSCD
jgi:flagellar biosynthesis/type III secretory pathway protein FliH